MYKSSVYCFKEEKPSQYLTFEKLRSFHENKFSNPLQKIENKCSQHTSQIPQCSDFYF